MKIRMNQPELLSIVQATATLYDEASIEATREKLTLRCMDPSYIALLNIEYPKAAFVEYDVDSDVKFGVRVDEVAKVVKRFDKKSVIGLGITQDGKLQVSETDSKFYTLRLIEASASSTPLPKLNLNAKIETDRVTLDKVLKDVQAVGEYLRVEAKGSEAYFSGQGDSGEAMITPDMKAETKEDSKATYSLDYLTRIVAAIQTEKPITIEFSSKMPMKLTFEEGRIAFYLAPRVSDD